MKYRICLQPDDDVRTEKIRIGKISALVIRPKKPTKDAPGILWIHGGGYILGLKEMVYMSRAMDLVKKFGAVVVSPGYRLAFQAPYPAALRDCYKTLLYMKAHAGQLRINKNQIMVGGESAGGGLCAALCMLARDKGQVHIAFQMPLYPMLDNFDTESSRDNHGKVWNTRRNHFAWRMYLRGKAKQSVSPYAAPAGQRDYRGLPPAYTFVGDGEPFYAETLAYVQRLNEAGVKASADVYHSNMHAFDMLRPDLPESREAIRRFGETFDYARQHYFSENNRLNNNGSDKVQTVDTEKNKRRSREGTRHANSAYSREFV